MSKQKNKTFIISGIKIILTGALGLSLIAIPKEQADAKGVRIAPKVTAPKAPKTSPKPSTPKPSTEPNKSKPNNNSNNDSKLSENSKSYSSSPYRQKGIYGNTNNGFIGLPWYYYPLIFNHHNYSEEDKEIQKMNTDEIFTIEDMSKNETQSKQMHEEYYNISFDNGITTTEARSYIDYTLKQEDQYAYIRINNTNIGAPVDKGSLKEWVNAVDGGDIKPNTDKTLTKKGNN